ncbi:MAG: undecaprenyldiphospho-muramoylpentapeptide beta-N-acetylglucosaminyltransferase [Firmicutes bacterium]|nr:undecaprenyldiphospho-muramoylpentapeptide beta-N-acetylglucosaminyltransferase [Bacillota bacterium]
MRFVITGGGTGGHIYPALAIARGLQERYPGAKILYIGTKKGLEADIVPRSGLAFQSIRLSGLRRSLTPRNLLVLWRAGTGTLEARKIIKKFKPSAVVGTGGYVCGPVVIAAASLRVPTLIHEQNALPGVTNRILSVLASQVTTTFEDSVRRFPRRARVQITGLPVRPEVLTADRNQAREKLGVLPQQALVLSFGGSQGARSINLAMAGVLKELHANDYIKFLHVTGQAQQGEFISECRRLNVTLNEDNIKVVPYLYEMPEALAAADLIICRAGAATLAEITVRGIPAVLIPYPYAAENHQEYNARALVRKDAAEMILDDEVTGRLLAQKINTMINNPEKLKEMAGASLSEGRPRALQDIIKNVDRLLSG